jgi:hypothetical protein
MEYTLEQKALAAIRGDLWWRVPEGVHEGEREWGLVHEEVSGVELNDLQKPGFVYHIGTKAPPIMSELEAELVSVIEDADADFEREGISAQSPYRIRLLAALKKARGEA